MTNPFITCYLPEMFWPAQLAIFGRTVTYLPQGDANQALDLQVVWKDGASDEDIAPGRYSHIHVQNADLFDAPTLSDLVEADDKLFQIARIEALAVNYSVLVLQECGPGLNTAGYSDGCS